MDLPILNKEVVENKTGKQKELPVKVIQFGTGVLLRGLPDYFICKANQQGIFNGKIVVIKSTDKGDVSEFEQQNALFTHCVRGIIDGKNIDTCFINNAIECVLSAKESWPVIVAMAQSPQVEIIISNTTEAGLVLDKNDRLQNSVPSSFPGKLLLLLLERWKFFDGDVTKGWVILPTELVPDNGNLLREIVVELAKANQLPNHFIEWLMAANEFCNTLVDRIVPGKLNEEELKVVSDKLGYQDNLLISSEPFALWAIEARRPTSIEKLSFSHVDESVVIAPSIVKFRDLKLRLLNGTHTFCCAVALLSGFETVIEAMRDAAFTNFIQNLLNKELIPALVSESITHAEATKFANSVIERFSNQFIQHQWSSIAMNFEDKMKMRNSFLIERYSKNSKTPSKFMSLGFAAFCIYMKKHHHKTIDMNDYFDDSIFTSQVRSAIDEINANGMKNCLAI